MSQPNPIKNDEAIVVDELIKDLEERKRIGIERYGVALQPFNGRNSLQDSFEEILDFTVYFKQYMLEQAKMEEDQKEFDLLTDDCIDELQIKVNMMREALEFIAGDVANKQALVAQQVLDSVCEMDKCEVHNIPYEECSC